MQKTAALRAARVPFVAHLGISGLTGNIPIRVEPVSKDGVQNWRSPTPGGLPVIGGGTNDLRDLA